MLTLSRVAVLTTLLLTLLPSTSSAADHALPDGLPPTDFDALKRPPPQTLTINRWPLSAGNDDSKRVAFGVIRYEPADLDATFTPIVGGTAVGDREVYRVGTMRGGRWVGSLVPGDMMTDKVGVSVTLRVDDEGLVWATGYDGIKVPEGEPVPKPVISIIRSIPGATPHLNKPVVLTPEGKLPEVLVEKTFLQKYWMIIAGVMFMLVLGGGGDK